MFKRLFGSYILIIVASVGIMGMMINLMTEQTFSRYLAEQTEMHGEMLPVMLAGQYSRNGNWDGVEKSLQDAAHMIGANVTLQDAGGQVVATTLQPRLAFDKGELASAIHIPIYSQAQQLIGTVSISRDPFQQRADEQFLEQVGIGLVIVGIVVALSALLLGGIMARSFSKPLVEMSQASQEIAQGNYEVTMTRGGPEEIDTLKTAFEKMAVGMKKVEDRRRKLVADVSHELRTPLTVVQGYLESLRVGNIFDRRSAEMAFHAMHEEVKRLLCILGDLQDLSIMDSGTRQLNLTETLLSHVIEAAKNRLEPLAREKDITLIWEQSRTSEIPVMLDAERMNQVLYNLVNNAIQHTAPQGQVRICCEASQKQCQIRVADNGKGIAEEHLPYIFERFYRADEARSHGKNEGAGIGLSIVKSIVEAHQGSISVKSKLHEGSTFVVTIPAAPRNL
ncbi:two-component sensor histidine kinase [Xylanibacillus composti]|uniref:histidine kinase n=1 Tax=Xylanibacillus composti TaxID=1572762 RepID=A0A8J4M2A3_9BACL|nr:HAMP domain-containing sensor histidine kinase [Xylanibacillus composti]GIQ69645.1 two-component sensor histidine kinase [Xylanibacillus composti]